MIATTLEQSRKLVELGIDPSTADMHYAFTMIGGDAFQEMIDKSAILLPGRENKKYHYEPAWSLAALLELMPHCIIGWDGLEYTRITKGNVLEYSNQESGYEKSLISIPSNNLLSPAYNMIIWLKENKYI